MSERTQRSSIFAAVPIAWLLVLGPLSAAAQIQPETPPTVLSTVTLTPGPLNDACRHLAASEAPLAVAPDLGRQGVAPGLAAGALSSPETWSAWRAALTKLRAGEDASARARLALIALEQARPRDAWRHLERAAASPGLLAALLPRFLPGVDAGTPLASGGRAAPLPDGVTLHPSLPPPVADAADSGSASAGDAVKDAPPPARVRRSMEIANLAVGSARIAMRVSVETEGIEIELRHLSGSVAHVSVVLPRVEDYGISAEYHNWFKQDEVGRPLAVELKPGEDPHVLFARFEPKDPRWPTRVPRVLPASIASGGLWLEVAEHDPARASLERIAKELSLPDLGLVCRLQDGSTPVAGGVVVDLGTGAARDEKLAWLVAALETFALEPRAR